MTPIFRQASVSDAIGIAKVQVSTWRNAYASIIDPCFLANLDIEQVTKSQTERIETDGAHRLVAVIDGEVIGYAVSGIKKDEPFDNEWFLYALYVLPECQGLGIGKALVDATKQQGKKQGFERLVFGVFSENEPSKSFYCRRGAQFIEQLGFTVGGKEYPTDYCFIPIN